MHEVQAKGILSAQNGMNIYRGCSHGCIYCDARSKCYQMQHKFEDIEVKANAMELLENALSRKRKPCMISTGAMCDPYLHIDEKLMNTRKCLEIIHKYNCGVTVQTKSARILRDLDLYKAINERTKSVVQMTLTTYDEKLCSIVEPNVSTTAERYRALCKFRDEKIPRVVWLTPQLPFINDTVENLRGILEYCACAQVKGIITFGLAGMTLREGDREYYYAALDRHFPGLKARYIKTYGNSYELQSPNAAELYGVFRNFCERYNIEHDTSRIFGYLHTYESKIQPDFTQLKFDI